MDFERGKAYVVDRGDIKPRYGQGLAAGLGVVLKHFRDAFGKKLDQPNETSGVFTVQYPEERLKLAEAYRNFPILLYDDASGEELCTSCFQCERICPPQVIHITQAKDPATGKAVPAADEFLLEYDACMSCGLCAEVCPFDAIKMDHEFELSTDVHGGLTIDKAGLNRPISYYERLAPTFWAEVKDSALKKLENNSKRRPGNIGNALKAAIDDRPLTTEVAPAALVTNAVAEVNDTSAANDQRPATSETATTIDDRSTPIEALSPADAKAAKLAAIRAKNAAKTVATTIDDQSTPSESLSPADAKAAKLAAIRAKNAAKQVPTDIGPIAETIPPEQAPVDAKAAKLAAIRAANAAKQMAASTDQRLTTNESAATAEAAPADPALADAKAAKLAAIRAANAAKRAAEKPPEE